MSLWIETAHQSLLKAGEAVSADVVRTFQTEEQFCVVLASSPQGGAAGQGKAARIADEAAALLEQGATLDAVVETLLAALPPGEHAPLAILHVLEGCQAHVVECDAPPLFLTRGGQAVLLPVLEDDTRGRLLRGCQFRLEDGDHLAMVSEGYLYPRRWGWGGVALAVKRWTDTRCDAGELLGALVRTYRRLNPEPPRQDVTVVAMRVRPLRTATVWSGPPADPAQDEAALNRLMAEPGTRILCGNTTAQIAARLLGATLELEPRPADGWAGVPPTSRLAGVSLVTEGLVTLRKARERMANGESQVADSSLFVIRNSDEDGATRLARALLAADKIHFIVGLAVNPQQATDGVPLRRLAVEGLVRDLKVRGKLVSVEYV